MLLLTFKLLNVLGGSCIVCG